MCIQGGVRAAAERRASCRAPSRGAACGREGQANRTYGGRARKQGALAGSRGPHGSGNKAAPGPAAAHTSRLRRCRGEGAASAFVPGPRKHVWTSRVWGRPRPARPSGAHAGGGGPPQSRNRLIEAGAPPPGAEPLWKRPRARTRRFAGAPPGGGLSFMGRAARAEPRADRATARNRRRGSGWRLPGWRAESGRPPGSRA